MRIVRYLSSTLAVSTLAFQAAAAGTPESTALSPGVTESWVRLGLGYLDDDNYHFGRYSGPVEEGAYPAVELDLRYQGEGESDHRYGRLEGEDLGLDSRRLRGRFGAQGNYGLFLEYDERPRFYDRDVATPLRADGRARLTLPDNGGLGPNGITNSQQAMQTREVEQHREKVSFGGQKVIGEAWKLNASFSREDKQGRRYQGYGVWNRGLQAPLAPRIRGFQMPAPVDHRTERLDVGAEYAGDRLQGRVGYQLSAFTQLEGDSFRAEDPSSASNWAQAEELTFSRAPENTYHRLSADAAYDLLPGTSLSGNLMLGRAEQDVDFIQDARFQAQRDQLGTASLDGQIDTTRIGLRGSHRLHPRIQVTARYRYDERANETPEFSNVPTSLLNTSGNGTRDTRAHGSTRHTASVDADVRLPWQSSLTLGYEFDQRDREYAEDVTIDDTYRGRLRSRLSEDLKATVRVQYTDRYGTDYAGSALSAHPPRLRLYNLADLQRWRVGADATYSVSPALALGFEVSANRDDYFRSEVGLQEQSRAAYTVRADYFPTALLSGHSFATVEDGERDQGGVDRSLTQDESTLTVGLGVEAAMSEREDLTMGADILYSETETDADVGTQRYPTLTTETARLELYSQYAVTEALDLRLAYQGQGYQEDDWALGYGEANRDLTESQQLLMGREPYDYTAHLVMGSVDYRF